MKSKQLARILVVLLSLLTVATTVTALGISPGTTRYDFTPGLTQTIPVTIINSEAKEMDVIIYPEGDLAEYITVSEQQLHFTPQEREKHITYTVNLPQDLETPGAHKGRVVARELSAGPNEGEIVVEALIAVATALNIQVPYPGNYLEAHFYVATIPANEQVPLLVQAHNLGTNDLSNVKVKFTIKNDQGSTEANIQSESIDILSGKRGEILSHWEPEAAYGQFTAQARITYSGGTILTEEQPFQVGQANVEVLSVAVDEYELGEVARFNILARNNIDAKIQSAAAHVQLYTAQGASIADFSSAPTSITALAVKELIAYWDTEGVSPGSYEGSLELTADGAEVEYRLRATVTPNSIRAELLDITGQAVAPQLADIATLNEQGSVAVITILIILANIIGWYFYFKRKNKGKTMDSF